MQVLSNDSGSRHFLCLTVSAGNQQLTKLCRMIDRVMESLGQPKFYEQPVFHCSIAWSHEEIPASAVAKIWKKWQEMEIATTNEQPISEIFACFGKKEICVNFVE